MSGQCSRVERRSAAMKPTISSSYSWQMQIKLSQSELERWAVTAWSIWNARNTFYFEQVQTHPRAILEGAGGLFEEYQRLMVAHQVSWCSFEEYQFSWCSFFFMFCFGLSTSGSCPVGPRFWPWLVYMHFLFYQYNFYHLSQKTKNSSLQIWN